MGGAWRLPALLATACGSSTAQNFVPISAEGLATLVGRNAQLMQCGHREPQTCVSLGYDCGLADDGCGTPIDCGACPVDGPGQYTCTENICQCAPTTCAAEAAECGSLDAGCGETLVCGS